MENVTDESSALLRIEEVSKTFGSVRVLENISLIIQKGERTALIGPNGAGKTTLFNIISGVLAPDSGRIVFNGVDVTAQSLEQISNAGITRIFQKPRMFSDLSVWENVLIGCETGAHNGNPELLATELIEQAGLTKMRTSPARSLTFADKRFLELARALGRRPRLLLMDEPAAGLSAEGQRRLVDFINATVSVTGTDFLLIEHCTSFVRALADRYVILRNGIKVFDGPANTETTTDALEQMYENVDYVAGN
jgi:branched-chain amino acid transport system ATP-binding protein